MMTATNRRVALTLIEILMTILVLAIGLLGVASLLPLGQQQMKRGIINQRTAELGDKALEAVDTYGLTNPARWVAYDTTAPNYFHYDAVTSNNTRIACPVNSATATTITTDGSLGTIANQYDDCFVEIIRSDTLLGLRRRADWDSATTTFTLDSALPGAPGANDVFVVKRSQPIAIDPYYFAFHADNFPPPIPSLRAGVPRLTLTETDGDLTAGLMNFQTATSLFVSSDDLIFNKSDDGDVLPTQTFHGEQFNDGDGSGEFDGANEIALMEDDFSTASTPPIPHRIYESYLDAGWTKTRRFSSHLDSAWNITGGRLENPTANTTSYVQSESPVWQWWTNPEAGSSDATLLEVSFDYRTAGADTVTAHFWAVQDGGLAGQPNFISNHQGWNNGNSGQNRNFSLNYNTFNLLDGDTTPDNNDHITGQLTGTATTVNLVGNGSFEDTSNGGLGTGAWVLEAGAIRNSAGFGSSTPPLTAQDGTRHLALQVSGNAGRISQMIDTTPGTEYELSFLRNNLDPDGAQAQQSITWSVGDIGSEIVGPDNFTYPDNTSGHTTHGWTQQTVVFTAVDLQTRIAFEGTPYIGGWWGIQLDNVSVSEIPPALVFTWSVDVSTLGIPGVSTVGDIDTFFFAIAANETGGGTTWVDNLSITATAANNPSGDTFNPAIHDMDGDGLYTADLKRQSEGSYSWLATLVPAEGGADTRYYTVSAAVFYKRPVRVPVDLTQAGSPQTTLNLTFPAGLNYGGGRATISTSNTDFFAAIFEDLDSSGDFEPAVDRVQIKANQWVLVTAPRGGGSPPIPSFQVCRWYRIGSVGQPDVDTGTCSVDVRLVGADWNTAALGTTANVTFYEGLKGVFQRTMPIKTLPIGNVAP